MCNNGCFILVDLKLNWGLIMICKFVNCWMIGVICLVSCLLKYFFICFVIKDCFKNNCWWIWFKYIFVDIFFFLLKLLFCVIWELNIDLILLSSCNFKCVFKW